MAFPYGVHCVVVGVDRGTGQVTVERYFVATDVGRAVNPMMIDGQVAGGVAQGIGGALYEEFCYDEAGQPLSATFADYLMPTIQEVPNVEVMITEDAPSPYNPLGIKGVGEAGCAAAGAAIASAIDDALGMPGAVTSLPMTPQRMLALLETMPAGAAKSAPHPSLGGAPPQLVDNVVMQHQRFRRRRDHGDANADIRMLAKAERTDGQHLSIRLAENLKTCMRQGLRNNADAHIDWIVFDQRRKMPDLRARKLAAYALQARGKIGSADHSVTCEAFDFQCRDEVENGGLPDTISRFAFPQDCHDTCHVFQQFRRVVGIGGNALSQDFLECVLEAVRGEDRSDRAGEHGNVLSSRLDLPHSLEVTDSRGEVFDTHSQQGRNRYLQQAGKSIERFDLHHLALLEAGTAQCAKCQSGGQFHRH